MRIIEGFEDIDKLITLLKENVACHKETWEYDDIHKDIQKFEKQYANLSSFQVNELAEARERIKELDGYINYAKREIERLKLEAYQRYIAPSGKEYLRHKKAIEDKNTPVATKAIIRKKMEELSSQWETATLLPPSEV